MLKARVITAIIALVIMVGIFNVAGPRVMPLFFIVLVGIGAWEIASMLLPRIFQKLSDNQTAEPPFWLRCTVVGLACFLFAVMVYSERYALAGPMLVLLTGLVLGVFLAPNTDLSFGAAAGILICLVYGTFPWLAIWELYRLAPNSLYVYLLCVIVWSGDTGAYFIGRRFGRRKLAPLKSPNKTWEGAFGGIAASVIGASIFKLCFDSVLVDWPLILICSVLGGAFGQVGDLVESVFKRFSGVKDSGSFFPGHGGFLDRVDGLLLAAPAIWFLLYQFGF